MSDIALDDERLQSTSSEFILTECARKEPALILLAFKLDYKRSSEPGFRKDHMQLRKLRGRGLTMSGRSFRGCQKNTTFMPAPGLAR